MDGKDLEVVLCSCVRRDVCEEYILLILINILYSRFFLENYA